MKCNFRQKVKYYISIERLAILRGFCLKSLKIGLNIINHFPVGKDNFVLNTTGVNQSAQHKIKITISGKEIIATLNDSKTSRDFISLLPLDLPLKDYASTEKIGYLPKRLTTENDAKENKRLVSDVAYYVPWGNLSLLYKATPAQENSLIILGKIDSGKEILLVPGSLKAKIELVK